MKRLSANARSSLYRVAMFCLLVLAPIGCATQHHRNSIPASAVGNCNCDSCRSGGTPINYVRLRQDPPKSYQLGPRDVLGVYIEGVLGNRGEAVPVHFDEDKKQAPAVGYPVPIREDGTVSLPLVPPIRIAGMTLRQAELEISDAYISRDILKTDKNRTMVSLMRPRTYQVLVIREDQGVPLQSSHNLENLLLTTNKKGVTFAVELPAYENDVLHALSETGGLPGNDAKNEVLILRGGFDADTYHQMKFENSPLLVNPVSGEEMVPNIPGENLDRLTGRDDTDVVFLDDSPTPAEPVDSPTYSDTHFGQVNGRKIIRIPMRDGCGGDIASVTKDDIILRDGDVVVVQSRESDVFYTGGLLVGGQHMLPRDYEIDILQAIAMAGGSVIGNAASNGQSNFGNNVILPATRATIVRSEGGQQKSIAVDLERALVDPRERITIKPGDFILLEYTPVELFANIVFSTFRLSYFLNGFGN